MQSYAQCARAQIGSTDRYIRTMAAIYVLAIFVIMCSFHKSVFPRILHHLFNLYRGVFDRGLLPNNRVTVHKLVQRETYRKPNK